MAGLPHSFKAAVSQPEDHADDPSSRTLPVIHQDNSSSSASGVSVPDHGHGTDHVEFDQRQQEQEEQQMFRYAPSWQLAKLWFLNQLELGIDVETLLRPHLAYLCTHTTNVARMMTILYSIYSFTEEQSDVVAQQSTSYDLCYRLYLIAMRKNHGKQLLEAWEGSGNHHIMQHLQSATTQTFEDQARCRLASTTESILSTQSSIKEPDVVIIADSVKKAAPDVIGERQPLVVSIEEPKDKKVEKAPDNHHFLLRCRFQLFVCALIATILLILGGAVLMSESFQNRLQIAIPQSPTNDDKCHWPAEDGHHDSTEEETVDETPITVDSVAMRLPPAIHPFHQIHLTIINRKENSETDAWLNWTPPTPTASKVSTLILMGRFSENEIDHFCQSFPNVKSMHPMPLPSGRLGDTGENG